MANVSVKALVSIKYNGKWRTPFTPSAIFDMDEEMAKVQKECGHIEYASEQDAQEAKVEAKVEAKEIAETQAEEQEIVEELMEVDGVNEELAKGLIGLGINGIGDLQKSDVGTLSRIKGVGKKTAQDLLDAAAEFEEA